jgi:GTP-binding protein
VGRPNAAPTLINQIVGEDRLLTGPEAGITCDATLCTDRLSASRDFDTAGTQKPRYRKSLRVERVRTACVRSAYVNTVLLDAGNLL